MYVTQVGAALVDIETEEEDDDSPAESSSSSSSSITPGTPTTTTTPSARSSGGHVVPFLLTDIGEGIVEVELMEWFVKVRCFTSHHLLLLLMLPRLASRCRLFLLSLFRRAMRSWSLKTYARFRAIKLPWNSALHTLGGWQRCIIKSAT